MAVHAAVGQASNLDGREAATQAAYAALTQMGATRPAAALLYASHEYDIQQLISGLSGQLGDTPIFGQSVQGEFGPQGVSQRSVAVALIGGDELNARTGWAPGFNEQPHRAVEQLALTLELGANSRGALLLAGSAQTSDGDSAAASLPPGAYTLAGALSGGELRRGRNYQVGGNQSGSAGVAALYFGHGLTAGVGTGHGWQPVGRFFKVTGARGAWLRMLDGKPASEAYASVFGRPAREWGFPPLNELVRLYPLGIETEDQAEWLVRTPQQVEADGSLRLNTPLPEHALANLLIGSAEACLEAARAATEQARAALQGATPRLAIVLADSSWQILFKGNPGGDLAAVRKILGPDVPVIGGYTLGQFAKPNGDARPQFLNQHMVVMLLGG